MANYNRKYPQTTGYWVYSHTTPNGLYYIGMSKQQPFQRWKKSQYKTSVFAKYITEYGWENIQHKVLIDGLTKEQAEQWEDKLIVALSMNGLCINENRSGGIARDNMQAYNKEQCKQWYEEHKEECKAYKKQYNEEHKEEKKAYDKQRYEEHKEERKQYNKQRNSTPEGKIYYRVKSYNNTHTPIETPMMAKLNYIMLGIVPWYIKNDDLM